MSELEEGPPQLTMDGGEVSSARANATSSAGAFRDASLTESQRVIIETIRAEGSIRSVEAGNIVHARRSPPCRGIAGAGEHKGPGSAARIGCCGYAAADGLSAMKRLADRGLVEHGDTAGLWVAATPD